MAIMINPMEILLLYFLISQDMLGVWGLKIFGGVRFSMF